MGYGRVRVSFELLCEILHFPVGTEIKHITMAHGPCWDQAEITVSHPDLKPKPEGEIAPLISPSFRKNEPVEFVDWGQS